MANEGQRSLQDKLLARVQNELEKPQRPSVVPVDLTADRPRPTDYAPPDQRPDTVTRALGPLPPYVTHQPDASRAAQIASHAVAIEWEQTAQALEKLGREYYDQAQEVIDKVVNTAQLVRDRATEAFNDLETSSKNGREIVKQMEEFITRMKLMPQPPPTMTETEAKDDN